MTNAANHFYSSIDRATDLKASDLVSFFVYFLTVDSAETVATTNAIEKCFVDCDLAVPGNVSATLSKGLGSANPKFVKAPGGYRLHRAHKEEIASHLGATRPVAQTSIELRKLKDKLPIGTEKGFLTETIDCFEAGANRATIIMCWILAVDHLCDYVFKHHLGAFNSELSKVTDKRVKVAKILSRDDFGDIPENKLVELFRAAGVISNDVRKILEEKLGTRNTCAHPSGIAIKPSKVIEFVDDLVENVVLKYQI